MITAMMVGIVECIKHREVDRLAQHESKSDIVQSFVYLLALYEL